MNQLIPVTIITGFLGSGKTTLLSRLIHPSSTRREPARGLALLINEFGEVSIDGALLRDQAGDRERVRIHDFPHGLIAYGDDELFMPTMWAIAARRAQVDQVLIETSGLALPTAVMERLQGSELTADFILDAVLAVVDTPLLLAGQFDRAREEDDEADPSGSVATLFERQLESADVVVLNKIDELDEEGLLQAEARVRQRASNVRFVEPAYQARLDLRLALGLRLHQPASAPSGPHRSLPPPIPSSDESSPALQNRLNGHTHSGLSAHSHGLTTHQHFHEQDPGWISFTLHSHAPQPIERLKVALVKVTGAEPILRIKGFVSTTELSGSVLVQGVRSRVTISDAIARAAAQTSELVFIGYHPNRTRVAALLSELTGTSWS
ncbi:MAG TPA: GTP-binding protein [Blastocatellia bacterium]|nr:GTP-binding protein [Blastocatellia bacterium]